MKIAVYDIGTNSIHLLIVEIRKDLSFEILDHEKDATRIGDGSFKKKKLSGAAMKRAFAVMDRFTKIAKKCGVRRTLAVATSAVREATNGAAFIEALRKRTGVKVRVISGREEGRLIFLAARSAVETRGEKALVIDIGGGSMELVLGDSQKHYFLESYRLGVARLTDLFIRNDPPSKKEIKRLEQHIESQIRFGIKAVRRQEFSMVIGTAGTMIALALVVHQSMKSRELQLINNFTLHREALEKFHKRLIRTSLKERLKIPGLEPKRADLLVAGSVLVTTLMRMLKMKRITISDKGIREGLVLDFIEKNKKNIKDAQPGTGIREKSVRQLGRRCAYNEAHAEQVARLAEVLFDATARLHRLGERDKELLRYASLLHDIGHYVSFRKHHKHSYYLIVNSNLDGFSPEEIEIMGAAARSHRKPVTKTISGCFVGKEGRRTISVLGALLRIADGLDRSYTGVVKSMDCRLTPSALSLTLKVSQDAELEMWQAKERADLFEALFNRKLVLQSVRINKKKG